MFLPQRHIVRMLNVWIFYNQLQWCGHLQKPLMALWTHSQTMTPCIFPSRSHWLGASLSPVWQGFPLWFFFFSWTFNSCADLGRLSAKNVWRITFSKEAGWESSPDLFPGTQMAHSRTVSWFMNTVALVDKLLAGTGGGAVSCCAGLLVTSWAAARGTGCFESLLKSCLRAVWTGLHFKCCLLILLWFVLTVESYSSDLRCGWALVAHPNGSVSGGRWAQELVLAAGFQYIIHSVRDICIEFTFWLSPCM